jgi:hypothetical protein
MAAYQRGEKLEKRRALMTDWAAFVTGNDRARPAVASVRAVAGLRSYNGVDQRSRPTPIMRGTVLDLAIELHLSEDTDALNDLIGRSDVQRWFK